MFLLIGVPKICSKFTEEHPFGSKFTANLQQIYRRTPIWKCDFNKVGNQLYRNHTSAWVFSVNLQQIYRRTPIWKCDFNKVTNQLYRNHTSAWVFSVNLLQFSEHLFIRAPLEGCFCCCLNLVAAVIVDTDSKLWSCIDDVIIISFKLAWT